MAERPIPLRSHEVRAILAGTKTQARRVATKPVRHPDLGNLYTPGALIIEREPKHVIERACPYGQPGDRLWVRETHSLEHCGTDGWRVVYACDRAARWYTYSDYFYLQSDYEPERWRPSIHMPRWASRITLEVTDMRVERLQDISDADAAADGCHHADEDDASNMPDCPQCGGTGLYTAFNPSTGGALPDTDCQLCNTPAKRFRLLWESINGPAAWEANPWVWVISFKRVPS